MSQLRGVFFDEGHARAVAAQLARSGFDAKVVRERYAGEDDDEDHPWAVLTDAPEPMVELLVEEYEGWLDVAETEPRAPGPRLDLPSAPKRAHRSVGPTE